MSFIRGSSELGARHRYHKAVNVVRHRLHGAKALESGTLIDVFAPVREDLLAGR